MINPQIDLRRNNDGKHAVDVRMTFDSHADALEFVQIVVAFIRPRMDKEASHEPVQSS